MSIYDTSSVFCIRFIGEINHDAVVTFPKCGQCANPKPQGNGKIFYMVSEYNMRKQG